MNNVEIVVLKGSFFCILYKCNVKYYFWLAKTINWVTFGSLLQTILNSSANPKANKKKKKKIGKAGDEAAVEVEGEAWNQTASKRVFAK